MKMRNYMRNTNITSLATYTNFSVPLPKNAYLLSPQRKASHS